MDEVFKLENSQSVNKRIKPEIKEELKQEEEPQIR